MTDAEIIRSAARNRDVTARERAAMLRAADLLDACAKLDAERDITIESYDTDEESGWAASYDTDEESGWAASCDGVVGQTDSGSLAGVILSLAMNLP